MRVVAGRYRSRPLEAPPGRETRPTADRVREALFSILGPNATQDAHVLDLFAGSGALGIEALSRGAASATFVEKDPAAAATIERNLAALKAQGEVLRQDALSWLASTTTGPFDLIFADPPYDSAPRLGEALTERLPAVTRDVTLIVTESDKRMPLVLDLPLADERTYGDTRIAIHRGSSG